MSQPVPAFVVRVTSTSGVRQCFLVPARSRIDALLLVLGQRGLDPRGVSARLAREAA